jgi:hypothetical protein
MRDPSAFSFLFGCNLAFFKLDDPVAKASDSLIKAHKESLMEESMPPQDSMSG